MRRHLSGHLPRLALLGTLLMGSSAFASTASDEAAILKIEKAMGAAQTGAEYVAAWDKNAVFDDAFALTPRVAEFVGRDAAQKDLDPQFASLSTADAQILRIKIVTDGKFGFAYSTQHFHGNGKGSAPALDFSFRQTDVLQKKAGKWLLIHQQISVPVDPATNKAIYDVK